MTWEETIQYIRTLPEHNYLVEKAYFDENLPLNIERFRKSEEFIETVKLLRLYQSNAKTILDIGSGNGISAVAFALEGFNVTAVEPDSSKTIGAGAIRKLKEHYDLSNLEVYEAFAEEIQFPNEKFDVVYSRQCMHHAYDLEKFVLEASRVLKKNGLFMTIRDHVVYDEKDKSWFLATHPLQKFYGGENAFTAIEYKNAMLKAGLEVEKEMKYFDTVINYYPLSKQEVFNKYQFNKEKAICKLYKKIGVLSYSKCLQKMYLKRIGLNEENIFNENEIPGRMYSYIALKR